MSRIGVALVLVCVAGAAAAPAAAEVTGPQFVTSINALRAEHGFPTGLVEDPAASAGCRAHNRYGALNDELTHDEIPGRPGYTTAGAQAGRTSGLYANGPGGDPGWTQTSTAFDLAPLHFSDLLNLQATRIGATESEGYGCVGLHGERRYATNFLATYPSDGSTGWSTYEEASESPKTPAQSAGLPERTGPTLFVLAGGPRIGRTSKARFMTGFLKGADGRFVQMHYFDNEHELGGYIPPGVLLLPDAPLQPNMRYRAYVRLRVSESGLSGARQHDITRDWSFTTGTPGMHYGKGGGAGSNPTGRAVAGPRPAACTRTAITAVTRVGRRFTISGRACTATTLRVTPSRGGRSLGTATLAVPAGPVRQTYVLAHPGRGRYTLTVRLGTAKATRTVLIAR